ncbi:hypothetical protein W97_06638 [Coniosporium apollinis CBS 100218]|uniref:Twin-arginine translocation pathway signal n=1 Tax=Coniosporium apollinis (strain CBS 100218) TaxID=1168221 RepID=R7YZJ6_CONA1|nr:uncharacterized protein W97_06638 [Coniosporium apollinis CBS 100218]EON67385.1 hypothetical protein W97_06638 [Coniosporium apollinis CBS 100218]
MLGTMMKWICILGPAVVVHALPTLHTYHGSHLGSRQQAAPGGLTDIDILQFALTLEHLESAFYKEGFAKFPASDFTALGLTEEEIAALQQIGQTEATHVSMLLSAIASAGFQPVMPCKYNFGFTDAAGMVATARVLEAVGVSAYLGAAPLLNSSAILSTAATILTVESRHQTFIRTVSGAEPVPAAFDTPLGPRGVFTLAAPFITECPAGSNLNVPAFPAIQLSTGTSNISAGQSLAVAGAEGSFCAFVNQGATKFVPLAGGSCTVPQGLAGEVYMMITSAERVCDDVILAGPSVLELS